MQIAANLFDRDNVFSHPVEQFIIYKNQMFSTCYNSSYIQHNTASNKGNELRLPAESPQGQSTYKYTVVKYTE